MYVCSEDAPRRKADPAPLRAALGRLGMAREECVFVGDAAEDIVMERRARVSAIGVCGPFPKAERVFAARPDRVRDSIAKLPVHDCAPPRSRTGF